MRAATASSASGPSAATVTSWPLVAPSPMTDSTLLASTVRAPALSDTAEVNLAAATASAPAGRACKVNGPARESASPVEIWEQHGHGLGVARGGGAHGGGPAAGQNQQE